MSLTQSLAGHFPAHVRDQGVSYVHSGAVWIAQGGPTAVQARVHGNCNVSLSLDHRGLGFRCSCPDYGVGQPCRHVWATLVAAERRGFLRRDHDAPALAPPPPAWRQQLPAPACPRFEGVAAATWPASREVLYVIDVPTTLDGRGLAVKVVERKRKRDGEWAKPKHLTLSQRELDSLPEPDRRIVAILNGADNDAKRYWQSSYVPTAQRLKRPLDQVVLPMLCATGRCRLQAASQPELADLAWEEVPWVFGLELRYRGDDCRLKGILRRGEESRPLSEALLVVEGGLVFFPDRAAPLDDGGCFGWIAALRQHTVIKAPRADADALLGEVLRLPRRIPLDLPQDLRVEEVRVPPTPCLKVTRSEDWDSRRLRCALSFDYDGAAAAAEDPACGVFQKDPRRLLLRDTEAERAASERLAALGAKPPKLELAASRLPRTVRTLVADGWRVEAEGKLYRSPGAIRIEVSSGIDWFDLVGAVDFEGQSVPLPKLLAALKRRDGTVLLGDGTFGVLPEDWLKRYALLAEMGQPEGEVLRFGRTQVGVLDALLAAQPEARVDEGFEKARASLRSFAGVRAADAPGGFAGELRHYQRDGLGWLHFLREFGFGGCLADDMGLGKTVQVLALLESRREQRAQARELPPSLVVMPRSLVFNWRQEAQRFAPRLRVLAHVGPERARDAAGFAGHDVVLTTYGTLRRDALLFKDAAFDYAVLDEAQAIKNHDTEAAKAARLLRARHRLALSGTPVENHLGELWSLFEFLNPGMLGRVSAFQGGACDLAEPERALLARALRPFILRRTKQQVVTDLPPKLEQTLYCELEPAQRKVYDSLRDHYRASLLGRVAREGLERSKILVLEALLRLRQAACHPGLIDHAEAGAPCAKLDALLPQLAEVVEEGHKALVFSQFTSFLAILRSRLEQAGIAYAYLDGQTRDREEPVRRFQADASCGVFLVSLKAGGLGLNLTAAEYVFLLDPWWNPAVEAQAVDRAHRIGQTRRVFAYRLVARDTVEEKVLQLQETKRSLADAIINADNSLIRDLGREDLELLLS